MIGTMVESRDASADVTRLLKEYAAGRLEALDELLPFIYADLQAIAHRQMRSERSDHTWTTRDLVHEAYIRLAQLENIPWQNRTHFFAVAGRMMQRLLINHARAQTTQKRGGTRQRVPLDFVPLMTDAQAEQLVELDEALGKLESLSPRCRTVVEQRVFAGMTHAETAEELGVSLATVKRDWTVARAWLNRALAGRRAGDPPMRHAPT